MSWVRFWIALLGVAWLAPAGAQMRELPDFTRLVEDYGAAVFTFANGAVALVEDTWTADRGYGFHRNEIIGTAGALCDDKGPWGRIAARGQFGYDGWVGLEPARSQLTSPSVRA